MADQGIRITFLNNAEEGDSINYYGTINGTTILYNNGLNNVSFEFTNNDAEILADPLHRIKIGLTAEESANNLKAFLDSIGYQSTSIPIYNRIFLGAPTPVWNVESLYSANSIINFFIETNNSNVVIVSFSETPIPTLSAKYFFQYTNLANDNYRVEIYEKNFSGITQEIKGRATISRSDAKDHFDAIRGTGLSLELESSKDMDFSDFYSKGETDFSVRYYVNNALHYQGFIKPDGIYQSFVSENWNINIECVDGLGFLSNISFLKDSGARFTGKMTAIDIIYNCLNKTGLRLKINTYVDIYFYGIIGEDVETDVLAHMKLNVDRFVKSDDNTTMSCLEVLSSVLEVTKSVIVQEYGEWYIYRPQSFYYTKNPQFKIYDINNNRIGMGLSLPKIRIGSHINGVYPHHCNANQKIEIKGAVSAFRLGYKYGFIGSLLGNGNLQHEAGTKVYEDWDVQTWAESPQTGYLVIDPVSTTGISFKSAVFLPDMPLLRRTALNSNTDIQVLEGYSFEFKTRFISYGFPVGIAFYIYVGNYSLNPDGSWYFSETVTRRFDLFNANPEDYPNGNGTLVDKKYERAFSIKTDPLPEGAEGVIKISMNVPFKAQQGSAPVLVEVKSIELISTFEGNNIVGEFHTVSRINPVSSIVKENKTVSNGDNSSNFYTGAIYMADGETLTEFWHRARFPSDISAEVKPILRISAEDELRISQKPTKIFSGDIFGGGFNVFYLGIYSIDEIEGIFMPVSYSFNSFTNICSLKLLELYAPEVYDIDYLKTDDYGETVKPTIVG